MDLVLIVTSNSVENCTKTDQEFSGSHNLILKVNFLALSRATDGKINMDKFESFPPDRIGVLASLFVYLSAIEVDGSVNLRLI